MAPQRDGVAIAAEHRAIEAQPLDGQYLVLEAVVARIAARLVRQEAEYAEAVVDGDDHEATVGGQYGAVEERARADHVRTLSNHKSLGSTKIQLITIIH